MTAINPKEIKYRAARVLEETSPDYRKTVVLHSGISLGALVVVMLLDLLISNAVAQTGGLAGIGTRSVLKTVQSALSVAVNIMLPFWELGILYTSLRVVRQQPLAFPMLTRGFHRLGPVVRYWLVQLGILLLVAMVCSNAVMMLTMWLPVPASLQQVFQEIDMTAVQDPEQLMAMLPMEQFLPYALPTLILFAAAYFGILIHLSYRFRLSRYLLLDEEKVGAIASIGISNHLTHGNKWNLFKLDLSFWWYYGLQFLISGLVYCPELLALAGVKLPMSPAAAGIVFYLLYAIASLCLSFLAGAFVHTSFACAYEQLCAPEKKGPSQKE